MIYFQIFTTFGYKSLKNSKFYKDYVNENRLVNVVSHIGEVKIPRDFGRLVKAMYMAAQ